MDKKTKALRWLYFLVLIPIFMFILFASISEAKETEENCDISYSFLGSFKKSMRFYGEIETYSQKYDVDPLLALVIMMYESAGNKNLVSHAGARGLMQVMPSTKKDMAVESNIEAGIKYLAYLKKNLAKFLKQRDGYVLESKLNSLVVMAYNGGPGRARSGLIKIETYQYLQGVSLYFNLLSQKMAEIEALSKDLEIIVLSEPRTWNQISEEFNVPVIELRLYNPFAAHRFSKTISKGWSIVYPKNPASERVLNGYYIVKHGEILHHLANAFGFTYNEMRNKGGLLLWGSLQPGTRIDVTNSPYLKNEE